MDYVEKFKNIFGLIKRPGADKLLEFLEKSDFFVAPASTVYHENYEGGLVEHSVKVCECLTQINAMYGNTYSEETIAIVSLLHDLCKIGFYEQYLKNVKDEETGTWHKEAAYKVNEQFNYGGHGSKSVFLVMNYIRLKAEEATAINCHMGPEDNGMSVYNAYRQYPLAFMLHMADAAATIPALCKEPEE